MNYKDIDWNEELVISTAINNIIDLKRNYFNLQQENHQLKDRIEKAIEIIENDYYSLNTTNIDDIVVSSNKFLKVRKILKGE